MIVGYPFFSANLCWLGTRYVLGPTPTDGEGTHGFEKFHP